MGLNEEREKREGGGESKSKKNEDTLEWIFKNGFFFQDLLSNKII